MNSRNDDSLEKENLNFIYKDKTNNENFLDKVIRAEMKGTIDDETTSDKASTKSKKKLTKDDIIKSVMEQAKQIKRDDKTEEVKSTAKYSDVAKTIPWLREYKRQPIEINKERIRTYLKYYKDLPNLIKLRENKILNGESKPENKYLEINKLENFDFLKDSSIDKDNFLMFVDYKLSEMYFYNKNLMVILEYLKKYMFISYQFIILKYYFALNEKEMILATNIKKQENMDNIIIDYIYEKLIEENKKECQS